MRWCYKTVHYRLKKEGLLGSSFLDEAEVEQSLNEYGRAGWELVSVTETQDGLIAIFKQPLDVMAERVVREITARPEVEEVHDEGEEPIHNSVPDDELVTEEDIIDEVEEDDDSGKDGLTSIRIE